jgi:hypothetical protein
MTNENTNTNAEIYTAHFAAPMIAKVKAHDNADKKYGKQFALAMKRDDAPDVMLYCLQSVERADQKADAVEKEKNAARLSSLTKDGLACLATRELRNEYGALRKMIKDGAMSEMSRDDIKAMLATIEKDITSFRFACGQIFKAPKTKTPPPANAATDETETDATPAQNDAPANAAPIERAELFAQFMDAWKNAGFGNTADFWDWTASQEADNAGTEKQAQQIKADKANAPALPVLQSMAG